MKKSLAIFGIITILYGIMACSVTKKKDFPKKKIKRKIPNESKQKIDSECQPWG